MRSVYVLGGFAVDSDLPLRVADIDEDFVGEPDIVVRSVESIEAPEPEWSSQPNNSWTREAFDADSWWLNVVGVMTVRVADRGRQVFIASEPTADGEVVSHVLVDLVLPVCFGRLGRLVLHATVVRVGPVAVAMTGATGTGKSTMAISLARSRGTLLADDCLVLDDSTPQRWLVLPTYPGSRLRADSAAVVLDDQPLGPLNTLTGKRRVVVPGNGMHDPSEPCPLHAIVMLDPVPGPLSLHSLRPVEAVNRVLGNVFHRSPAVADDADLFGRVVALVDGVTVLNLTFERDYSQLPTAVALVSSALDDARSP